MSINKCIRDILGWERREHSKDRTCYSFEEQEIQNRMNKVKDICDVDSVEYEAVAKYVLTNEGFEIKLEYIIVPVYADSEFTNYIDEDIDIGIENKEEIETICTMLNQAVKESECIDTLITLNIDSVSYTQKPNKRETGAIQKRIAASKRQITVKEFAESIEKGMSFKAAALNGNKNIDWKSQNVFALDIDNDMKSIKKYGILTPEEAYRRFSDLGVPPTFYYESFSSTKEIPKFRLIFILGNPVEDIRIRNSIQMALMTIMPESDPACKDLSRLFYGTNSKCITFDDYKNKLDPYILIQSMVLWIRMKDLNRKNVAKSIQGYCRSVGINMINGLPNVMLLEDGENYGNTPNSIIYNINQGTNPYKSAIFNFSVESEQSYKITIDCEKKKKLKKVHIEQVKLIQEEIKDFNFEELDTKCELWSDFRYGSRWCYHNEVFSIACNMWRIRGAESRMISAINNNDNYEDKYNKINTIKACKSYGYAPKRCADFCPYYDKCSNKGLNILHAVDNKRASIRKVQEIDKIPLDDATRLLYESVLYAFENEDEAIHVIKGATGIGKTEILKNLINCYGLGISYPTHRLGIDIVERLNIENSVYVKELELEDEDIVEEFRRLQRIGAYNEARIYLKEYSRGLTEKIDMGFIDRDKADKTIRDINEYFKAIEKCKTTTNVVFCTQKRMLQLNNPNIHTYIIDEDILLSSLAQTIELKIDLLDKFISLAERVNARATIGQLSILKEKVIEAIERPGYVVTMPAIAINDHEIDKIIAVGKNTLQVNLRELLQIKVLVSNNNREVLGMRIEKLPNKKCIILSATANETIYKKLLPNREVNFIDIGDIETKGELVLHYKSFSRTALNKNFNKKIEKIINETKDIKNVITFSKYKEGFRRADFNTIAHFGAASGLDGYKGEDLIVAGTPHVDERVYLLLAAAISNTVDTKQSIKYRNVRRNGFEFYFNTYEEGSLLQEIQFYFIESHLIQAVGRARILRTDATVHLFSNYPLKGAVLYDKKIS